MAATNSRDRDLRERAAAVIPGGMYGHQAVGLLPDDYPQFFERGEGAHIWDVDGRRYLDFMCAYGPNLFGYAHPEIDAAYVRQLGLGDTLTGPTALMVELAEALTRQVTHADWAIFCKNGTDATTMALTTARAHTRRRKVIRARGAYHGAAPWCVPRPAGVIDSDKANQIFCDYNDVASLEAAVAEAGDDLAAIFAAPFKHDAFIDQADPDLAYARKAREQRQIGCVPDSDPQYLRSGQTSAASLEEIFVLGCNHRPMGNRPVPDGIVFRISQARITNGGRLMSPRHKPCTQSWRKIGIDEEFHAAVVSTG